MAFENLNRIFPRVGSIHMLIQNNFDERAIQKTFFRKHSRESVVRQWMVIIATILFISSYFIAKGPTISDIINLTPIEMGGIGLLFLIRVLSCPNIPVIRIILRVGFVYTFLVAHAMWSVSNANSYVNLYHIILKTSRLYGYLVIAVIFSTYLFSWKIFIKWLYSSSLAVCIFGILTYLFFPDLFSEFGYGFTRVRAFFSEPSAFGPIISLTFYISLKRRSWIASGIALVTFFVVESGTAYAVLILVGVVYILRTVYDSLGKILVFISLLVIVLSLMAFQSGVFQDMIHSWNYQRIVSNIDIVLHHRGGRTRFGSLFRYYDVLKMKGHLWFGMGLNTAKPYFGEYSDYIINREFSVLHSTFFSFGIFGIIVLFVLLIYTFIRLWLYGSVEMLIVYASFTFASLINSSGGHVLYKFCYIFIVLCLLKRFQKGFFESLAPAQLNE